MSSARTTRKPATSSLRGFRQSVTICLLVLVCLSQIEHSEARRSNGLIQRCANDARDFLRWFCMDPSFNFPFPFSRIYITFRYRPPFKDLYPFQHQASVCCRFGCPESSYRRMCQFHKKIQRCEQLKNIRTTGGRKKRRVHCRLTKSLL